ncbi:hypothetical protein DPMN_149629 [Dreissena polymorpha]|uniref:Uncharacterized protein n=1 Tax=Dreissena polymorpha TaxID=45954 RepID=A0A9D4FES0_DREPO|nr:hypothetical protein DPMN_149629 [Dreissena polymorpha]
MFLADCGMSGNMRGASVSVTSTQLGGTATYTCNLGYGYTGGDLTHVSVLGPIKRNRTSLRL